ncbi:NfeD family protein [Pollutimonas bauzanensis]|uniref:Membrane-bound serine protease (ClpP class) n=1 Tax=Pollutimonas bauzanensis TaxID=658167 RepID=A0A1M5W6M8_9BURK|nr:nodulation protein NfeD [Pollutimonas bauzanensis]SHH83111.1 membrane-bound serine protease (ClpP class) [Pollutimonas bauzanensis]
MSRTGLIACGMLLGILAFAGPAPSPAMAAAPKAVVLQVDGIISPATSDFIARGLAQAAQEDAMLAVIELDTPGGLDTSMRSIIRQILASPVPVATFVSPGGARAASAGTFILYASHIAAMTPASNLGAASPVSIGMPGSGAGDKPDAQADKKTAGDTMSHKVTNDAAAYIRSLAQLRGRNADFAEKAVLEASSLSAQEALKAGAIDLVAANVQELLQKVDGRTVKLDSGKTVRLETADATIVHLVPDWRNQVLALLANPQIALILMMVGIYGLFFELTSPGIALPGVAGLICLLLGLYAFQMLPVNWAGVALIAAGAAMMIGEAFLPSFGVLGIGGIIAFVLGGLFLTDTGIPEFDLSIPFVIGLAVASAALIMLIGAMAARAHKSKVVSGREEMPGMEGVVTSAVDGMVYAELHGESWRVRCNEPLSPGDRVRVVAMDGLTLQVTRAGPAAAIRH